MFDLRPVPIPDLSGKAILVTGAGRGIGAELVRLLVTSGAQVFAGIHRLGQDPAEPLPAEACLIDLDVTSQAQTDAALARIADEAGRLDVLVNNAGVVQPIGPLHALRTEDLAGAFAVNFGGVHRVTTAALPLLRQSRGTIVNAGTGAAAEPLAGWTAYCSSKAAALMLTRMFDLELAGDGIKSFFIGIPPTDTTMQDTIRRSGINRVSKIAQSDLVPTPVPASVMAWLCGPQAREIKEVVLDVRQQLFKDMMA